MTSKLHRRIIVMLEAVEWRAKLDILTLHVLNPRR
jgi:hypothetical protein